MITIEADNLGEHMRVAGIALRTRRRVPLPVLRRRQRVDREHLVTGRPQRAHPWSAVGLDANDHLLSNLLSRQRRPLRRGMFSHQRMKPGDAVQALR